MVNLASRLVGVAKAQDVEIVTSEMTLQRSGGMVACKPLGVAAVRGKALPVKIHTLAW